MRRFRWKKKEPKKTIPAKRPKRRPRNSKKVRLRDLDLKNTINFAQIKSFLRWVIEITFVCFLAYVFVAYFGQRVSTVGDSMSPTLYNSDVVLVDRFIYNISSPKRGDVIVFKPKGNENSHYYTKRIVGLPGETVSFLEGEIYIDGEKLEEDKNCTPIENVGIVTEEIKLKGNEYFVLGDERSKSEDSRMADVGNVKRSYIYGKARVIVSPLKRFGFIR